MDSRKPTKVDPFRPLLIEALEGMGSKHSTDWANRLRSEHAMEKAAVEGPRGGITPELLTGQMGRLKKVTEVNTPFAQNLTIKRDGDYAKHDTGTQFTDFVVQTRQHLREIAETDSGRSLFKALDQDITGKRVGHKVQIQDAGPIGLNEGSRTLHAEQSVSTPVDLGGFKLDWPGLGSGAVVSHHTDFQQRWGDKTLLPSLGNKSPKDVEQIGVSGALALGHELIHAAHGVHGFRMQGVNSEGVRLEEISTVGPQDGKSGFTAIPTENALRREMTSNVFSGGGMVTSMGIRTKYNGKDI